LTECRAVRLRALRGAITVDANEAEAILSATTELVSQVMERNCLAPDDVVSCIFTCTDDLNAEFPAVAARRMAGSSTIGAGHWPSAEQWTMICWMKCSGTRILRVRRQNQPAVSSSEGPW
jgi:hypothetical protein